MAGSGTWPIFSLSNIPAGTFLTSLQIDNELFVSENGNNATAMRGRLDRPYKTPLAAVAAAQAGDTVVIFANNNGVPYAVAGNLMKPGVNITGVNNPNLAGSVSHLFTDSGGAYTGNIVGLAAVRPPVVR